MKKLNAFTLSLVLVMQVFSSHVSVQAAGPVYSDTNLPTFLSRSATPIFKDGKLQLDVKIQVLTQTNPLASFRLQFYAGDAFVSPLANPCTYTLEVRINTSDAGVVTTPISSTANGTVTQYEVFIPFSLDRTNLTSSIWGGNGKLGREANARTLLCKLHIERLRTSRYRRPLHYRFLSSHY